ncbi:MAG: hypothetical protein MUC49_22335 [Raineya sp.]|jgi:hypothetical protein|nr:hypothetical protein [Raineya sp.]
MKKITLIAIFMIATFQIGEAQMVVSAPILEGIMQKIMITDNIKHKQHLSKVISTLEQVRETVRGVREVKREAERWFDFYNELTSISDFQNLKSLQYGDLMECLLGYSLDPKDYLPRFNKRARGFYMGCPSIEKTSMMLADMSNLSNRWEWEKMLKQKGLLEAQYVKQLIEKTRETLKEEERILEEKKLNMDKGDYLKLKLDLLQRMKDLHNWERANDKLVLESTKPSEIEKMILKEEYQRSMFMNNLILMY